MLCCHLGDLSAHCRATLSTFPKLTCQVPTAAQADEWRRPLVFHPFSSADVTCSDSSEGRETSESICVWEWSPPPVRVCWSAPARPCHLWLWSVSSAGLTAHLGPSHGQTGIFRMVLQNHSASGRPSFQTSRRGVQTPWRCEPATTMGQSSRLCPGHCAPR